MKTVKPEDRRGDYELLLAMCDQDAPILLDSELVGELSCDSGDLTPKTVRPSRKSAGRGLSLVA